MTPHVYSVDRRLVPNGFIVFFRILSKVSKNWTRLARSSWSRSTIVRHRARLSTDRDGAQSRHTRKDGYTKDRRCEEEDRHDWHSCSWGMACLLCIFPTPKCSLAGSMAHNLFAPAACNICWCSWPWFWIWRVEWTIAKELGCAMHEVVSLVARYCNLYPNAAGEGGWTDAPLSDLELVPESTAMWQPGQGVIFHIGRAISNTLSYLEQPATQCSIITQHPPTSRGSGKIPPELGEEGSNRLPVHLEKSSPSVVVNLSHTPT